MNQRELQEAVQRALDSGLFADPAEGWSIGFEFNEDYKITNVGTRMVQEIQENIEDAK